MSDIREAVARALYPEEFKLLDMVWNGSLTFVDRAVGLMEHLKITENRARRAISLWNEHT